MKTIEYIKQNGLKALTDDLAIAVKPFITPEGDTLYLLDYNQIDSPKCHPVVMECRSLIIDSEYNVVSRSFDRFFNISEAPDVTPKIDWSTDVVASKVDGSLTKVFCYKNTWYISTRGTAFADSKVGPWDMTFRDLVLKALDVYDDEEFQNRCNKFLDKENTYIFEVTSMENRVVTRYEGYTLHLLAIRNNLVGNYIDVNQLSSEFRHKNVKTYSFATEKECIDAANNLPDLEEGYVVYKQGIPICKIKSPLYVSIHYVKGNGLTPRIIMEKILENEVEEYLAYFPEDAKHFLPYQKALISLMIDVHESFIKNITIVNQKDFAMAVKDTPFAAILFFARKSGVGVAESFELQTAPYKLRLLETYVKV